MHIRAWRIKRGLTQVELAKKVGVTQSYIGQLERDEKEPSLAVLRRLSTALAVPVSKLF